MLRAVLRQIDRWFGGSQDQTTRSSTPDTPTHRQDESAFAARVATAEDGRLVAGSFELLDLTDLKSTHGDNWDHIAQTIHKVMSEELEVGLGEGDTFRPVDDLTFVVCFADTDTDRSSVRADAIAANIRKRLAEQLPATVDRIGIDRQVASLDNPAMIVSDGPMSKSLLGRLHQIRDDSRQANRVFNSGQISDTRLLFQPCWRRSTGAIALNRVVIDPVVGRSILDQVRGLSDPDTSQNMLARLDFAVLSKAVASVHSAMRRNHQTAPLIIPVQQSTLVSPEYLAEYLQLLDTLPDAYRPLIYLEALSSPRSGAVEPLSEALLALRKRVGKVLLRVQLDQDRLIWMTANHLWGLTIDLSDYHNRKGPLPVEQIIRSSETLDVHVLALGANTLAAVQAADAAGIDYIAGGAVHLVTDAPKGTGSYNPFTGLGESGGNLGVDLVGITGTPPPAGIIVSY